MPLLLALLIGLPLAEIALLIAVGGEIGLWATLALLLLAGLAGMLLIRASGPAVLWQARAAAAAGQSPAGALLAGAFTVVAGILLIVPGFLTDILALLLLVPAVQALTARRLPLRMAGAGGPAPRPHPSGGPVIDGDFTEVTPGPARPGSPWSQPLPPR
jgi:UPF0716 protein FxsA